MYRSIPFVFREKKFSAADALILFIFFLFLYYFITLARESVVQLTPATEIDLSVSSLPKYSFFSLIRASIAYLLSLVFTLIYGYVAAKSRLAERILIPLLDIAQSIPVLGFLPGLTLGLIGLFPHSNIGLELTCVLLIFTGQVWNMTLSFYTSVRTVPTEYYEMSRSLGLNWFRQFIRVELPYSAIPLAWNSLMSMAGGWFFLTVCESFMLGNRNFRLPGLGAYMATAIERSDTRATLAGIAAMSIVILFMDFIVWRPVIAWTSRFRSETPSEDTGSIPFVGLLLKDSFIVQWLRSLLTTRRSEDAKKSRRFSRSFPTVSRFTSRRFQRTWVLRRKRRRRSKPFPLWQPLIVSGAIVIGAWGLTRLWELVRPLSSEDWRIILFGGACTLLRVIAALVLATAWALPAGIWIGSSARLTKLFQPIVQLAASFPAPMLYPFALAVLAFFQIPLAIGSVALILLGVQWYVLFNVIAGATGISHEMRDSLHLIGIKGSSRWKKLDLPSVFPSLVTGWVTAAGGAWNACIVAEYITSSHQTLTTPGLGSLISVATAEGNFPRLAACLLVMVITVLAVNRTLWRPLQRLAETRFRLER